ncbi:MAG: hypothetical protein R3F30_00420 [Planctomycetota bacterium]
MEPPPRPANGGSSPRARALALLLVTAGLATGVLLFTAPSGFRRLLAPILLLTGVVRGGLAILGPDPLDRRLEFEAGLVLALGAVLVLATPLGDEPHRAMALGVVMLVCGMLRCIMAFDLQPTRGWSGVLFGGILGCMLGALVVFDLALPGQEALGLFLAAQLLVDGLVVLPLTRRSPGPGPGHRGGARDSSRGDAGCQNPTADSSSDRS